ncbi:hypothetical protein [uncultured Hoeflea sp.]|uniref:hypothetical protein n=1 Tax=uncultured Hoeflea sp. TaxID=538666 RepID=UPI0026019FBB|nr:hypothetical protein [uncultured Hoeflea sp.]
MQRAEATVGSDQAKAHRVNRLTAVAMVFVTAAALALLRPELFMVFIAYVAMSVFGLSLARRYGIMVKPCPVAEQNFVAYVAISTMGFLITLAAAPEMIVLLGSAIYAVIAVVIAMLVVYAIARSL